MVRAHQHATGARKGDHLDSGKPPASARPVAGGLTTKVHTICDGGGRNLATHLTPGQDADTSQLGRVSWIGSGLVGSGA
jgi:hypothetical protein